MPVSSALVELKGEQFIVSYTRNISRLKETEKKLRDSEAMMRGIIDASPDAITITRLSDGTYKAVNEGFIKQFGFSREEAIGNTPLKLGLWAEPSEAEEFMRRLRADSVITNIEISARTKSGTVLRHLVSAVLSEIGAETCIV